MTNLLNIIHKQGPHKEASRLVEEMLRADGTSKNITNDCERYITDFANGAIIFTGEALAGTSSILNMVLEEDILPLCKDCFTSPGTVIRYSARRYIRVVYTHVEPDEIYDLDEEAVEKLGQITSRKKNIHHFELRLPHPILKSGIVFIETPDLEESEVLNSFINDTLKKTTILGLVYVSRMDTVGGIQQHMVRRLLANILDKPTTTDSDQHFHSNFDLKYTLFVCNNLDLIPKNDVEHVKKHIIGQLFNCWSSFDESQVIFCSMKRSQRVGIYDKQLLVKLNSLFTSAVQKTAKELYKWMKKVVTRTTHYLLSTVRLLNLTKNDRQKVNKILKIQLNRLKAKSVQIFRKPMERVNVVSNGLFVKLKEYIKSETCKQILTQNWSVKELPSVESGLEDWDYLETQILEAFYGKVIECLDHWYIQEIGTLDIEMENWHTKHYGQMIEEELETIEKEMHPDSSHTTTELSESLVPQFPDVTSAHQPREWIQLSKLFDIMEVRDMSLFPEKNKMKVSEYRANQVKVAEEITEKMYQRIISEPCLYSSNITYTEGFRTGGKDIPQVAYFTKRSVEYIVAVEEHVLRMIEANELLLERLKDIADQTRKNKLQYVEMLSSVLALQNSLQESNEEDSVVYSDGKVISYKPQTPISMTIDQTKEERNKRVREHAAMSRLTGLEETQHVTDTKMTKKANFRWQKCIEIGAGQFGKVYSALNIDSGELMAIKEMQFTSEAQYHIKEIVDVIKIFEGIRHPNLVKYFGVEVHETKMTVFTEYCDGKTLTEVSREGLTEDRVRIYTKELLDAVQVLHDNDIVHRDIKGANIFVTSTGCLKLGHFIYSAKLKSHTTMVDEEDTLVGTTAYMAPEVITRIKKVYSTASDIWSVGCVVIEMASGKPPWHELENNVQIMFNVGIGKTPSVPENLCDAGTDFLSHCLDQEPNNRWTASQLRDHPFTKLKDP